MQESPPEPGTRLWYAGREGGAGGWRAARVLARRRHGSGAVLLRVRPAGSTHPNGDEWVAAAPLKPAAQKAPLPALATDRSIVEACPLQVEANSSRLRLKPPGSDGALRISVLTYAQAPPYIVRKEEPLLGGRKP